MTSPIGHHHGHAPANRRRRILKTAAPLLVRVPATRVRSAVIVLHDGRGLTAAAENCCRALAACGHLAVAPLLYYETGGPVFGEGRFSSLRPGDLAADIAAALDHLGYRAGIPRHATGVLGLGQGAHLAAWAAAEHALPASIGVAARPGPWPGIPPLAQLTRRLGPGWLALRDDADTLDEAVRFLDAALTLSLSKETE
jgi:poly(3-hydroxybutyrate) depolymerase